MNSREKIARTWQFIVIMKIIINLGLKKPVNNRPLIHVSKQNYLFLLRAGSMLQQRPRKVRVSRIYITKGPDDLIFYIFLNLELIVITIYLKTVLSAV